MRWSESRGFLQEAQSKRRTRRNHVGRPFARTSSSVETSCKSLITRHAQPPHKALQSGSLHLVLLHTKTQTVTIWRYCNSFQAAWTRSVYAVRRGTLVLVQRATLARVSSPGPHQRGAGGSGSELEKEGGTGSKAAGAGGGSTSGKDPGEDGNANARNGWG